METLQEQMENVKLYQELILAGALTGRTGRQENSKVVGKYGENTLNGNGENLSETNCRRITNGYYRYKELKEGLNRQQTNKIREKMSQTEK